MNMSQPQQETLRRLGEVHLPVPRGHRQLAVPTKCVLKINRADGERIQADIDTVAKLYGRGIASAAFFRAGLFLLDQQLHEATTSQDAAERLLRVLSKAAVCATIEAAAATSPPTQGKTQAPAGPQPRPQSLPEAANPERLLSEDESIIATYFSGRP